MTPVVVLGLLLLAGCNGKSKARRYAENAGKAFGSGDYNRAEVEYKNLLREEPGNVEALERLGIIWQERGAPVQAVRILKLARKSAPDDPGLRVRLARALGAAGMVAEARAEALELLEIRPGDGAALVVLALTAAGDAERAETLPVLQAAADSKDPLAALAPAYLALREGNLAAAAEAIEKSLALDARSPAALACQGEWHRARGELDQAGERFREAAALSSARSPERTGYAAFLFDSGKRDVAVSYLNEAVEAAPDFLAAWRLLAEDAMVRGDYPEVGKLLANVFAKDSVDYDAAMLQSRAWLGQGGDKEVAKAVSLMEKLAGAFPASPAVAVELARARNQAGMTEAAAAALRPVLTVRPDHRDAVLMKAGMDLNAQRFAEAATAMEGWLAGHPGDGDAVLTLAAAYRALGRREEALTTLEALSKEPAAGFQAHVRLAAMFQELGRKSEAREVLEKAAGLRPDDLTVAAELVKLELQASDHAGAVRRAEASVARHPGSAVAWLLRATARAGRSDWSGAEGDLKEAVKRDPSLVAAHELMAKIYSLTGRKAEAQVQLEKIREVDPSNASVLMTLGGIYHAAGEPAAARECYEAVLQRQPSDPAALNNLGSLLAEPPGEDLNRARKLVEDARSRVPGDPAIADTLGWILFKQGEFRRARDLLREAAVGLPEDPQVKFHLGMACRAMGDEQGAREAWNGALHGAREFSGRSQAMGLLARWDAPVAPGEAGARDLESQVKLDPADGVTRLKLAIRLEESGRPADAAKTYEAALSMNPEIPGAELALARLYFGPLDSSEKASEHAMKAREQDPENAEAAGILGSLAFRSGALSRADDLFRESLARIGDRPEWIALGARAAYSAGRVDEAVSLMEKALLQSKQAAGLAADRRFLDLLKGDASREVIEDSLAADPDDVPALMARAALLEKGGEADRALVDYRKALKRYPDFKPAREAIDRLDAADPP